MGKTFVRCCGGMGKRRHGRPLGKSLGCTGHGNERAEAARATSRPPS